MTPEQTKSAYQRVCEQECEWCAKGNIPTVSNDTVHKVYSMEKLDAELSALRAELEQAKKDLDEPCPTCANATLAEQNTTLRTELESVKAERDRQYEFNAEQIAKYAALEVEYAESVTTLCFVRSRLIGLRHEACNDELHELSEELTGILSFIDAAISATTAEPEAACKESLQVQPPAEKETGR